MAAAAENRSQMAINLLNLGSVARATGEAITAEQQYQASLALGREIGNGLIAAAALDGLGQTRLMLGDLPGARSVLREGLETAVALKSSSMILTLLASVGRALARQPVGAALLFLALSHENTPHHVREEVLAFAAAEQMTLPDLGQPGLDLEEGVRLSLTELSAEPAI